MFIIIFSYKLRAFHYYSSHLLFTWTSTRFFLNWASNWCILRRLSWSATFILPFIFLDVRILFTDNTILSSLKRSFRWWTRSYQGTWEVLIHSRSGLLFKRTASFLKMVPKKCVRSLLWHAFLINSTIFSTQSCLGSLTPSKDFKVVSLLCFFNIPFAFPFVF